MQTRQPNLFTRSDTLFGVCEGLGEDFGIHSNFLRLAGAGLLFWNPPAAVAVYAGAGLLVALSRWLVPNPRPDVAAAQLEPLPAQDEAAPLPLAA